MQPMPPNQKGRFARSLKSCACGCVMFPFVSLIVAWAMLGWMLLDGPGFEQRPADPDALQQMQIKVDRVGQFYNPKVLFGVDRLETTHFTEPELDSYVSFLRTRLQSPYREAVEKTSVELKQKQFVVRALVKLGGLAELSLLPWPFSLDTVVELRGKVEMTPDGKGAVVLENLNLGSIHLPGDFVLEWLVKFYPRSKPVVEMMRGFPLPIGARSLEMGAGEVRVEAVKAP